jgi:predicted SnoaL-like aldol condensation-catalyzing enzyme
VVKGFIETILIGQNFPAITDFISQTDYAQHNTGIADGLDGLNTALAAMARQGLSMTYSRIHKLIAEGNFVLAVSEGQFAGAHSAFYDLFRLEAGKIVEHWDIISEIPADMAHSNGKF